ncbi:MAG: hypothetical protein GY909_00645 [Oligoflexia bacterium]|nr:hypothetical protein [Oligoflexia bacterium]
MKIIKFLLLSVFLFQSTFASSFSEKNRKAIVINPSIKTEDQLIKNSGDKQVFEGTLCAIKNKDNSNTCFDFDLSQVKVKSYFPDTTMDVTNDLELIKQGNLWKYRYETPVLDGSRNNQFELFVTSKKSENEKLIRTKAKLERRISYITRRLEKIRNNRIKKFFEKYLALLVKTNDKITKVIEEDPSILARYTESILIDNRKSDKKFYSSNYGGMKFSIKAESSTSFENTSNNLEYRVVNIANKGFIFPVERGYKHKSFFKKLFGIKSQYNLLFSFNGEEVNRVNDFKLDYSDALDFSFNIDGIDVEKTNLAKITLIEEKYSKWKKSPTLKTIYEHNVLIDVAKDNVSPVWSSINNFEIKDGYFIAEANDSIGYLKEVNVKDAETQNEVPFELDKISLSKFEIKIKEENLSVSKIILSATDFSGNISNKEVELITDTLPPVIALIGSYPSLTKLSSQYINLSIQEDSDYKLIFSNNGNEVFRGDNALGANIVLNEEENNIVVYAEDIFGNRSNEINLSIEKDTVQPTITVSNIPSGQVNFDNAEISFSISDRNFKNFQLYNNNQLVTQGTNSSGTFSVFLSEGSNTLMIDAIDEVGNVSQFKSTPIIKDTTLPVIAVSDFGPYTKEASLNFNVNVAETNFQSIQIFQNTISKYLGEQLPSYNLDLSEGNNQIIVKVVDKASNQTQIIKNITLDTLPPVIIAGPVFDSITNQNSVIIPLDVVDSNFEKIEAYNNGNKVYESAINESQVSISLDEGDNNIYFVAIDKAKNKSNSQTISVKKDTVVPILTALSPESNSEIQNLEFTINGSVSEELSSLTVNGISVSITNGSFSYSVVETEYGTKSDLPLV